MALEKTEAVVLKTFNWADSSRTVIFFTDRFGKLPLVDKGGRAIKSKRGRLMPFARLELTFYSSRKESSGYISDISLVEAFTFEGDGTLGRLAYGSAACELVYLLLADEEPHPDLYSYLTRFLRLIDSAGKSVLPTLFVTFFLHLLSQLGYHPSLTHCIACGRPADPGIDLEISPQRGGFACRACQKPGEYYIRLTSQSHRLLLSLQVASLDNAATVAIPYTEAGVFINLLKEMMAYQAGIDDDVRSLQFLDKLKNSQTTG